MQNVIAIVWIVVGMGALIYLAHRGDTRDAERERRP